MKRLNLISLTAAAAALTAAPALADHHKGPDMEAAAKKVKTTTQAKDSAGTLISGGKHYKESKDAVRRHKAAMKAHSEKQAMMNKPPMIADQAMVLERIDHEHGVQVRLEDQGWVWVPNGGSLSASGQVMTET